MAQSNEQGGDEVRAVFMPPKYCEHGADLNTAVCLRCDGTAIYTERDRKQHELEARAAIRTAVERATPKMWPITDQPDEYARQKAIGHNQAITDYKANLERELFG